MPYSRHVGYLCPGITLSRRVITGRHAALRSTRSHTHAHTRGKHKHTRAHIRTLYARVRARSDAMHTTPLSGSSCASRITCLDLRNVGEPVPMFLRPYRKENANWRPDLESDRRYLVSDKLPLTRVTTKDLVYVYCIVRRRVVLRVRRLSLLFTAYSIHENLARARPTLRTCLFIFLSESFFFCTAKKWHRVRVIRLIMPRVSTIEFDKELICQIFDFRFLIDNSLVATCEQISHVTYICVTVALGNFTTKKYDVNTFLWINNDFKCWKARPRTHANINFTIPNIVFKI